MRVVSKHKNQKAKPKGEKKVLPENKKPSFHPKFGTSKLEQDFAKNFLDVLGVEYVWQFEAKDIGRFFDFKIKNGPIIEVNGSYWHGDGRLYEEEDLNRIQRKAQKVDEYKQKWALSHGIPIIYVWEKDIKENPKGVMEALKERLYIEQKKSDKTKKRHKNPLK